MINNSFETLGLERVEFRADNDNIKSIAAMQSIGCTIEGVLRSDGFKPTGLPRNSIVLSILKTEWISSIKHQLKIKL